MASNEEYGQKQFWDTYYGEKTISGVRYTIPISRFHDAVKEFVDEHDFNLNTLNWDLRDYAPNGERTYYLVLSEAAYDKAVKEFGENCGLAKNVKVIRGYPKFNEGKNK